ncbi:motility protein A [Thiomicrorhabdus indica]|uniref:motility protein A n=1 Tax=Thiomicrorhabdus indica TaxID=2267253 RepID=UPI00102DFC91|nr:MotA/TolQ/ExbB proton channel family protein [Thiomicrorhabdus indica]
MSKLATMLGLILGLIMIGSGIYDFESQQLIDAFFNPQALAIVLGGSLAALLINYPFKQVLCVFHGFVKTLRDEPVTPDELIDDLVSYSHTAKNKGVLALEKELEMVDNRFLRFAMTEMLIYRDKDQLKQKLISRLLQTRLRHQTCQEAFENLATYAPAFGMLGTVMGLIMMMTVQVGGGDSSPYGSDSTELLGGLLTGMGLALVTTFYGVLFANLLFLPIAGKLRILSDAEMLQNEMIIEAVMAIKQQESTLLVRERLLSYLNDYLEEEIIEKAVNQSIT